MISAVSNRGLMRFMLYDGALNVDRFLAFLPRLAKDARQKVFLIVDKLRVHHAKKVTAWVASHAHAIAPFYLPAPGPDPLGADFAVDGCGGGVMSRAPADPCDGRCASGRAAWAGSRSGGERPLVWSAAAPAPGALGSGCAWVWAWPMDWGATTTMHLCPSSTMLAPRGSGPGTALPLHPDLSLLAQRR
jgi:hypothetical protein